jgi:thioredoxin reductase (NADPH)
VVTIEESRLSLKRDGKEFWIDNDLVFPMIGYTPDTAPLKGLGVEIDKDTGIPSHDPETYETNVPGLFVCGALAAGNNANSIFIENGKLHGEPIVRKFLS